MTWTMIRRAMTIALLLALALGSPEGIAAQARPVGSLQAACRNFAPKGLPNRAGLTSVRFAPDSGGLPAQCVIRGKILSSPTSTINFRIDLPAPAAWNGKTLMIGGGGFDGIVPTESGRWRGLVSQMGVSPAEASTLVVGSTDSGHQGRGAIPDVDYSWSAHNPSALLNHASEANHLVLGTMVGVARAFYGKAPARRYMLGLSNGGRQGLMAAQRHPEDYDGILAMAPAISQTAFAANLTPIMRHIYSDPANWLDRKKLELFGAAELAACDELDGVKDGLISNYHGCRFDPATIVCKGADDGGCLTPGQVETIRMWMGEKHVNATMANGLTGYAPYGPGGPLVDWAFVFGTSFAARDAFDFIAADNIVKTVTDDPVGSVMRHDPAQWSTQYLANSELIDATSPDLGKFVARGRAPGGVPTFRSSSARSRLVSVIISSVDMTILPLSPLQSTSIVAAPTPVVQPPARYAFVNVSVVPMDRDRILSGQTVVVEGDRITALGPTGSVTIPAGAVRIDGRGKFLIPGLAEMHAHIPPGPRVADSTIERVLALFVLNGVTTVRGMLGDPRHLSLRDRAARGELLSPTIYTSSPSVNGTTMRTGAAAIDSVTKYRLAGYDFLKIHPGLSRAIFDTMAATAKRVGIRFAGHVPLDVGIERAIEAGYWSVDHFDGVIEGLVPETRAFTVQEDGFFGLGLIDRADERRIPVLAAKARAAGVWVVPTETLMRHIVGNYSVDQMRNWPENKYMTAAEMSGWVRTTASMRGDTTVSAASKARYLKFRKKLIKQFHDAGVGFLLGSDAPQVWNVPGFSLRRELAYLVDAGLTPFQALESGTRNVAVFFGTEAETGTIGAGKRADLILLDGNPLQDIANVGRQSGVMVRGRWLDRAEVARRLQAIEAK